MQSLANCFASALLMPSDAVLRHHRMQPNEDAAPHWWMMSVAAELQVSPAALQWRCVQLGLLKKFDVVDGAQLEPVHVDRPAMPRRLGRSFVVALRSGLEAGRVSVRRAASLLGMTIDELADLFREHELVVPFDL